MMAANNRILTFLFFVLFIGLVHSRRPLQGIREALAILKKHPPPDYSWWKTASFYQIYPRSFKDSNDDGIGDLRGIIQQLPYLQKLGIRGFWMSPIFKSPMADFGYDISDYYDIQPEYGTLADFDSLVAESKKLGLKVILDFVPNHSSDEHEWFKKSENRDNGFEDFYVWHPGKLNPADPAKPLPPTNWVSLFRGSAWQWSDKRKEFYLHQFSVKQPDLNYRNPKVVEQMKDVMRFWLKRGVDGYRIDAVPTLFEIDKDAEGNYLDEPLSGNTNDPDDPGYTVHVYTQDRNETLDMVYQWRAVLDDFQKVNGGDARIMMTESYSGIDIVMKYYGNSTVPGSHIPFNFRFITNLWKDSSAYDIENTIRYWMSKMPNDGAVANWVMGNHDQHRVASRFGENKIDSMNMILLSLPGISISYNGEEIGMTDVWISYNDTVDPAACNAGPDRYQYTTRDPERTPFQWDTSKDAGFSKANKTWLPVSPVYKEVNVELQQAAKNSHLKVYKRLMDMRTSLTWQKGQLETVVSGDVLVILRELAGFETLVTLVNNGKARRMLDISKMATIPLASVGLYRVVSVNSVHQEGEPVTIKEVVLDPYESVVIGVKSNNFYYEVLNYIN
ncbi:maltase A1-like [Topomyia yanbarensis]|uniref:maltase A1-like n=1 Tax=Topomyia yanbarensis TaxID=2498891 RepID=UPI00273AAB48|nr:maltase A1-like [Topomyia yanbarensis]